MGGWETYNWHRFPQHLLFVFAFPSLAYDASSFLARLYSLLGMTTKAPSIIITQNVMIMHRNVLEMFSIKAKNKRWHLT